MSLKVYDNVKHFEADKIKRLVFNKYNLKIFQLLSEGSKDTDYIYNLYIDKKLSKNILENLQSFISGIIATLNSF
jgi:hypothetical protein